MFARIKKSAKNRSASQTLRHLVKCLSNENNQAFEDQALTIIREHASNPDVINRIPHKNKDTALMLACRGKGNIKITKALLAAPCIDVNVTGVDGTALILATERNLLPIIKLLLKAGAYRELKNSEEQTAADIAESYKNKKLAKLITGYQPTNSSQKLFAHSTRQPDVDTQQNTSPKLG